MMSANLSDFLVSLSDSLFFQIVFLALMTLFGGLQILEVLMRDRQIRSTVLKKILGVLNRVSYKIVSTVGMAVLATLVSYINLANSEVKISDFKTGTFAAIVILVFATVSIWIAANKTPRKLLIAVGAALAFVLAAMMFELVVSAIFFIENAPQ